MPPAAAFELSPGTGTAARKTPACFGGNRKRKHKLSVRPASSTSEALPAGTLNPAPRPLGVQVIWLVCVVTWAFRGWEKAGGLLSSDDLVPSQAVRREKAAPAAPSTLAPTGHLPRGSGACGP